MSRRPLLALAMAAFACSEPNLEGLFSCAIDGDCSSDQVCAPLLAASECGDQTCPGPVPAVQLACQARTEIPIRIGMSGPLVGPSAALGIEMSRGITAYFGRIDRAGGVYGRKLELVTKDDSYNPALAIAATKQLLDVTQEGRNEDEPDVRGPRSVFALLGNVGTPTMLATAPIANRNQVVYFGPFTGSQRYLRDGTNSPYVYNYRAGYFDETMAMVDFMAKGRQPRILDPDRGKDYTRLIVFAQNDTFGDAGYAGVVRAYGTLVGGLPGETAIKRIGYTRDEVDSVGPSIEEATAYIDQLLAATSEVVSAGIVMIDTYQPGNRFIRGLKDWQNATVERARRLDLLFINVSFVGSDSLADELAAAPDTYVDVQNPPQTRTYREGVMVTQVVPYYHSETPAVREYREDIADLDGGGYTFTSLEGYLAARLFVAGLELNGPSLTTESLRQTLDSQVRELDIGIGTPMSFGPTDRQASDAIWGTRIESDGSFNVRFSWHPTGGTVSN
jgi:branched-chain amino acid transport system substrate-binding protein